MKTAEEWAGLITTIPSLANQETPKVAMELLPHIKQIQLDAMKEGMRRGASVKVNTLCNDLRSEGIQATRQAILTAAKQLTEKDL